MKEVKLPSGAILKITPAAFEVAEELFQCVLAELKGVKLDPQAEVDVNMYKDSLSVLLSSKRVRTAVWECMKRATYNDVKIDKDTFEPEAAREDYLKVCLEVAQLNVGPFMKNLYAELRPLLALTTGNPT